jgi:hypothetical protein
MRKGCIIKQRRKTLKRARREMELVMKQKENPRAFDGVLMVWRRTKEDEEEEGRALNQRLMARMKARCNALFKSLQNR